MRAFGIIRQNWRPFLVLNVIFIALFLAGMFYAQSHPEEHRLHVHTLKNALTSEDPALPAVATLYYAHRTLLLGIVLTFLINLLFGSLLLVSVPSLVVPFAGLVVVGIRLLLWGMAYSQEKAGGPPGLLVTALEGEGYILAAFGTYLLGTRFLFPSQYELPSRKVGFRVGIKMARKLYWPIGLFLLAAAWFEAPQAIPAAGQAFPPGTKVQSNATGDTDSSVVIPYSGSPVFFDTRNIRPEDARVVGLLLEDISYFRPHDPKVARISQERSELTVELYLDEDYWNSPEVTERFSSMLSSLRQMNPSRRYRILVFTLDDSGGRQERAFKN
jgi:hypothetical protein